MSDTRVFFVTEGEETNREIHETLEKAIAHTIAYMPTEDSPQILVCIVKNAYWEEDLGVWNYEDEPDTFTDLTPVKTED